MANPEHLDKLLQALAAGDISIWNVWRKQQIGRWQPDLSDASLSHANLVGADLSNAVLTHADLSQARLTKADLSYADLRNAQLSSADLSGTDMYSARAQGSNLAQSDLSFARLGLRSWEDRTLAVGAGLQDANLSEAQLRWTDLSWMDLSRADLSSSQLLGTDLTNATLAGARFDGARMGEATFIGHDLSQVQGLETIKHERPSFLGIDVIYKSNGMIPESFLRGCGVPDTLITFARSLVERPIQFYSAFISYSSRDQDFASRLHADLQARGVRVWFAPEDLKIGDKFRSRIDEAIRLYDKLMVVLSEHSIQSDWVEKEVETAFEKEQREKRAVLFPIRLDSVVMETNQSWAADIRRTRHIGDFTKWKSHDDYQKAFERLLRDLNAEPLATR